MNPEKNLLKTLSSCSSGCMVTQWLDDTRALLLTKPPSYRLMIPRSHAIQVSRHVKIWMLSYPSATIATATWRIAYQLACGRTRRQLGASRHVEPQKHIPSRMWNDDEPTRIHTVRRSTRRLPVPNRGGLPDARRRPPSGGRDSNTGKTARSAIDSGRRCNNGLERGLLARRSVH